MLDPAELVPQTIRPLKRSEYDRLVASGAFEGDRVELIRGTLVTMAPNDPDHANPIDLLNRMLVQAIGDRARVRIQQSVIAADESEPQPDVAIVPPTSYAKEHPSAALLVIEVASSSLTKDRRVKAPLYAASGFPEYWIVNVREQQVEVFRKPIAGAYTEASVHGRDATVSPEAFPDIRVPVAALFE